MRPLTSVHAMIFILCAITHSQQHIHINIYTATRKYEEISASNKVPEAVTIPSGFEPWPEGYDENQNNQMENCILFVLHVSAPPYLYFNYGFIIQEKDVSDNDKLEMRIIDLEKENADLKRKLNNIASYYQQQINALQDSMQRLERRWDEEMKVERMDLELMNNWVRLSDSQSKPEAIRIRNVVYLKGTMSGGTTGRFTTLPQGWRPHKYSRFLIAHGGSTPGVEVVAQENGAVYINGSWKIHACLDGLSFVLN